MSERLITRATAKAKGYRYYRTGKECRRGHTTKRTVSDGRCVECRLGRTPVAAGVMRSEKLQMMRDQNHKCLICTKLFTETPHVDHCHKTGIVRGLLCRQCNLMLGMGRDDWRNLRRGFQYLLRFESEHHQALAKCKLEDRRQCAAKRRAARPA